MTTEQELLQDTQQLKQLISQVNNSGLSALGRRRFIESCKRQKGLCCTIYQF